MGLSVVETCRASTMHSSSLRGYGTFDSYEGCRGLYPATSRLQSVPPRFYDLVDGESGQVLASDLTSGRTRARSMIQQTRLAEERAWPQPLYGDMVTGSTASAGHYSVPRTSGEFSRDIISRTLDDTRPPMTAQGSVTIGMTITRRAPAYPTQESTSICPDSALGVESGFLFLQFALTSARSQEG